LPRSPFGRARQWQLDQEPVTCGTRHASKVERAVVWHIGAAGYVLQSIFGLWSPSLGVLIFVVLCGIICPGADNLIAAEVAAST